MQISSTQALFLGAILAAAPAAFVAGEGIFSSHDYESVADFFEDGVQCSRFTLCRCNATVGPKKLLHCPSTNGTDVIGVEGLRIVSVRWNAFHKVPNAESINLANNLLKTLPSDVFSEVKALEKVSLNGNQLLELPGGLFRENRHLSELDLQRNSLNKLPEDLVFGHTEFKTMRVSLNGIASLPRNIFQKTNLSCIDMQFNKLETLPNGIFRSVHMPEAPSSCVNLTDNKLTYLPWGIFDGISASVVGLADNPGAQKRHCPQGTKFAAIKPGASQKFCMNMHPSPIPTPSGTPSASITPTVTVSSAPSGSGTPFPSETSRTKKK
eukprot:gb/GECG01008472.1/.p1 GENE.gb/GECG01008472.1/~~gb/GECG01008472.1/.p1  ORF type:complete len:324 (+),score=35.51 gb/GECG01008472.1/:1-972(+)